MRRDSVCPVTAIMSFDSRLVVSHVAVTAITRQPGNSATAPWSLHIRRELGLLPSLADDGRQVLGQALAPIEAAFLDYRGGCPGLVQIGV